MSDAKHSPLPWRKVGESILGSDNDPICHMTRCFPSVSPNDRKMPAKDAEFILKAANAHDEMLSALDTARSQIILLGGDPSTSVYGDQIQQAVLDVIDAAIAKGTA